jgi:hypothetical protein
MIKKVKHSHYRPELAYRVDRGIVIPFRDLSARKEWVVSTKPRPLHPREIPGIHVQEVGWAPGPVWTCAKNLAPTGFDPRTVQPVASPLTD